ncbi:hypothetical protein [Streptomyces deserti]
MAMTISGLQQLCAEQGLTLPALHQGADALDGTPVYVGQVK